jgi:hypothetical protein
MKSYQATCLLALGLLVAISFVPIRGMTKKYDEPQSVVVHIVNHSNTCAWFTVYRAIILSNYRAEHSGFVRPGTSETFVAPPWNMNVRAQIKVRAEVTRTADCKGGTIADISEENKNVRPDPGSADARATLTTRLTGTNPYQLSVPIR